MKRIGEFKKFEKELVERIIKGEIGVIPTDTVYGIVCSATNPESVERVYTICKRELNKPFIVTISKISDLKLFGIKLEKSVEEKIKNFWPGEVSVVLKCEEEGFRYLHRGLQSIAFRLPREGKFLNFLKKTGPLVATSANPQGESQANTIVEAKEYFKGKVEFYVDGGKIVNKTSTLIQILDNKVNILREGSFKIKYKL